VKPYSLSVLPLVAAAVMFMMGRRQRLLVAGLGLATALACARLSLTLSLDDATVFLGQQWMLDQLGQALLVFMYAAAATMVAIAAVAEQAESFSAPALATCGLLSAVVLLRSVLLSFMLFPAALLVLVLATSPSPPSAVRGASRLLTWITLPILCVPVALTVLERFALSPDELVLTNWSAWLVVPPIILWLTLFPVDGTTRLWSRDGLSLASVFAWTVKDWVVVYLLLMLWRQYPVLHTESVGVTLGIAGLATAVVSGVLALAQSSPSGVLACAAMSELGIAVQGLTANSADGALGGLFLLVSRSVAVLLASSALAAWPGALARDSESNTGSFRLRSLAVLIAFAVGVLAMAGLPPLGGFLGRERIYPTLQAREPYLLLAWLSASVGIVLGLVRTGWSLWHTEEGSAPGQFRDLPLLLVLCLLLLCLWIGYRPQATLGLISDLFHHTLPLFPL
jgi:hypothetical protein